MTGRYVPLYGTRRSYTLTHHKWRIYVYKGIFLIILLLMAPGDNPYLYRSCQSPSAAGRMNNESDVMPPMTKKNVLFLI